MADSRVHLLRKHSTAAEKLVWRSIRAKQLNGLRFRRQFPIGRYVVDFVCLAKRLIIEIDGGQQGKERDALRDSWFRSQGFRVMRFWNHDVMANVEGVLTAIAEATLPPDLLPQGEEE
jgi:very-short-patch-repair endonuclease